MTTTARWISNMSSALSVLSIFGLAVATWSCSGHPSEGNGSGRGGGGGAAAGASGSGGSGGRIADRCNVCATSADCSTNFCNRVASDDLADLLNLPAGNLGGRCSAPGDMGRCDCGTVFLSGGTSICIGTGCPGTPVTVCQNLSGLEFTGATGGTGGTGGTASSGGGTTGTGGRASGTAGSNGGTTGAGGSASSCISGLSTTPASKVITDFSDAVPDGSNDGDYRFGGGLSTRVQGGTVRFANPSSAKGTFTVENSALTFTATVAAPTTSGADQYPFNGFDLNIDGPACTNGSAYSGVSFTISGTLGGCALVFSFVDSAHIPPSADSSRGTGIQSAYPPQLAIDTATSPRQITYAMPIGGQPATAVDPRKLIGFRWQLTTPGTNACTANITIGNLTFYP